MILNRSPRRGNWFVTARQLEREIEKLGREAGFKGDCFATVPQVGNLKQEADYRALFNAIPIELKRIAGPLARRMARSFAFTATPIEEQELEGRWA